MAGAGESGGACVGYPSGEAVNPLTCGCCRNAPNAPCAANEQYCSRTCQAHPVTGEYSSGGGSGCQFGAQCCFGTCASGVCA